MELDSILYSGKTKKDHDIIIRYPKATDLLEMTKYINTLSNERTFIFFQGEQNTVEEEKKYLDSILKEIENYTAVYLYVFCGDTLIGAADIKLGEKVEKHVGLFGITVAKQFRGEGIGKLLMSMVLREAKKQLSLLKICTLTAFGDNKLAINMYKKMGFEQYGLLPNGILHKETFVDHVYMYKAME
jgi:ribosomal protein S18 acetylase RimI-like enzyme